MPHKKGHSWGDLGGQIKKRVTNAPSRWSKRIENVTKADRKGNVIQRARHDQKVKDEDKKFVKKWEDKNKRAKKFGRGSDGPGMSAADRLEARKRHRVSQEKKQDRAALKKSDPAKYKAQKKAERKAKLRMKIRGRRS